MKFMKSDLAKKLIIILIVLLLFNTLYPSIIYAAVDFGGILLQPLYWLLLGILIPADLRIGLTVWMQEFTDNGFHAIVQTILGKNADGNKMEYGKELKDWFIGPDTIFCGRIQSLNANIFEQTARADILGDVSTAVAKFYVILRNIAAIVMLAGLIFTGIRILLSANIPTKKTQYLMLLQDWLIGMALLIFSHIIMILIFEMSDALVDALSKSIGAGSIKWELIKGMGGSFSSSTQLISLILYIWIGWLTIVFAIAYFKRYFWTCILTIFAPVMCVMYAFGQQTKQIYGNWLKEYILNAFVQPFHMIVYTVLIGIPLEITSGGAFDWGNASSDKLTYALMAMSMIRPAEKYLRRLLGMDKGIANMASYDSGKQTITDIGKAVAAVAKTAVAVGGTVVSAGAAAGLMGATGATSSIKQATDVGNALGENSEKSNNALTERK